MDNNFFLMKKINNNLSLKICSKNSVEITLFLMNSFAGRLTWPTTAFGDFKICTLVSLS